MASSAAPTPIARRRLFLKALASTHSLSWRLATQQPALDGITRIETRTEALYFEDGVCVHASSRAGDTAVPCRMVGMKLVAWIDDDDALSADYFPGARAVLWRMDDENMTVALTGRAQRFEPVLPLTGLTSPVPLFAKLARLAS